VKHVRSLALLIVPALALLSIISEPAHSQTSYISTDTTINTDLNSVIVGYANALDFVSNTNGTSPTVDLVSPGSALSISEYNSSTLNINGGSVSTFVRTFDNSRVFLTDGSVDFGFTAKGISRVHIDGGMTSNIEMLANSRLSVTAGDIESVLTTDHAVATVSGGMINDFLEADGNSVINVWGGMFMCLFVQDNGHINLFGMDLTAILVDPNYLDFYTQYTLSGQLADGTDLTGTCLNIENNGVASFSLTNVPEPGMFAYLSTAALGIGMLVRRRRKSVI